MGVSQTDYGTLFKDRYFVSGSGIAKLFKDPAKDLLKKLPAENLSKVLRSDTIPIKISIG